MIIIRAKKLETLKDKAEVLAQVKKELSESPIVLKMCEEHKVDIELVLGIPIDFCELDVSAKTIDSKVYLNEDLLLESFEKIMRYAVHEITHAFQHMNREHLDHDPYADDDYLDRDDEQEAFKNQLLYQSKVESVEDIVEYVEDLFDHHDIPGGERKDKLQEIMTS
jgi:hypothetical protein